MKWRFSHSDQICSLARLLHVVFSSEHVCNDLHHSGCRFLMPSLQPIVAVALQVLCVRSVRCKTNGVNDGDPSAPRTEKSTAHDCVVLSPRNQAYRDPQSSQVLRLYVCVCVCGKASGKRRKQRDVVIKKCLC